MLIQQSETSVQTQLLANALEITRLWIDAHMENERKPYGFWDLYSAHREFCEAWWIMSEDVA